MDLKELLGDELYAQVMEKVGDRHKIDIVTDGRWIPKDKFDAVCNERKEYKEQVGELNKQLGDLKSKLKDDEDVSNTIDNLKKQIQDKEAELANTRKENAIKVEVLKANPNDVLDILPHLKQDIITLSEDGTITGLTEQLESLKENKPYLFKNEKSGTGGSLGAGPKDNKGQPIESLGDALKQYYEKN